MTAVQNTLRGTSNGLAAPGAMLVAGYLGTGITHIDAAQQLPAEPATAMLVAGKPLTSSHTVVVAV